MVAKIRNIKKERSGIAGLIIGLAIGLVIVVVGAMMAAYLILHERLPAESTGFTSIVVLFISALVGNMVSVKFAEKSKAIYAGLYAVLYIIMLLIISMLFFDGISGDIWKSVLTVAVSALFSIILIIVPHRKKTFRKIHSR